MKCEPDVAAEIQRLRDELSKARDRIQALEERLEMTHVWTCKADKPEELVRAEIPPEERVIGQADAVDCRDETIKLLDARIERQVRRIAGQTMRIAELDAQLDKATGFLVGTTKDGARITVERREQRDGTVFWAVSDGIAVLGESGNWEHESRPSERSEAFIARTRFTLEKAFKLAETALREDEE